MTISRTLKLKIRLMNQPIPFSEVFAVILRCRRLFGSWFVPKPTARTTVEISCLLNLHPILLIISANLLCMVSRVTIMKVSEACWKKHLRNPYRPYFNFSKMRNFFYSKCGFKGHYFPKWNRLRIGLTNLKFPGIVYFSCPIHILPQFYISCLNRS